MSRFNTGYRDNTYNSVAEIGEKQNTYSTGEARNNKADIRTGKVDVSGNYTMQIQFVIYLKCSHRLIGYFNQRLYGGGTLRGESSALTRKGFREH